MLVAPKSVTVSFFSVGQDESYYEALNRLAERKRAVILKSLRDIAADNDIYHSVKEEDVVGESLLRSVTLATVMGQFTRMASGGARLTKYSFKYMYPESESDESLTLDFRVTPESHPPENIHVIIGRNGVGKTTLLNNMARSLLDADSDSEQIGKFDSGGAWLGSASFANLVSITFSAFDPFEPISEKRDGERDISYSYVGLKTPPSSVPENGTPKSPAMLGKEFSQSVQSCLGGVAKTKRWCRAMETLETDPIFKEAEVAKLAKADESELEEQASYIFTRLSSGHKIVLLTISKLVERVVERTLVLLDEPEAHLHPPLLASFVRAISDLLIDRNGVAIIATHSPVVLQEVPASCVWKLFRSGSVVTAERPELETFGENVGTLTRDVFGLEVTHSGFHQMLKEAVDKYGSFDSVLAEFGNQIGLEGKAIVRALLSPRVQ